MLTFRKKVGVDNKLVDVEKVGKRERGARDERREEGGRE